MLALGLSRRSVAQRPENAQRHDFLQDVHSHLLSLSLPLG
jgi:hypothetical protein